MVQKSRSRTSEATKRLIVVRWYFDKLLPFLVKYGLCKLPCWGRLSLNAQAGSIPASQCAYSTVYKSALLPWIAMTTRRNANIVES